MRRKRILILTALCALLLGGCTAVPQKDTAPDKALQSFTATYLDLFDTVTWVKGYAGDPDAFAEKTREFRERLQQYHALFDIYSDHDGVTGVKYLNDHAGETVTVDPALTEFLLFCRDAAEKTGGKVDVTLGAVLKLWHEARECSVNDPGNAYLPETEALREAMKHTGFDKVELDPEKNTVRFLDPMLSLDVGAVAKGYAVQKICAIMEPGFLISVGGNVFATGPKADTGAAWVVGVQDPLGPANSSLHRVELERGAAVSSGDYQRSFTFEGKTYHHIIDPETLFPAARWRGVTVLCSDSGIADVLSTALFLSSLEEGKALLEAYGAEAVWVDLNGNVTYSDGYEKHIRK